MCQLISLVTGANRGIGLGIAECCLSNGATKVYSIDIGETGEDFAALSKRYPGQLFAVVANVTEESTISAAIDKIIEEAGALHGMVVNAGAYVYLLSEAASYTTSIDIPVNGVIGSKCFRVLPVKSIG